MKKPILTVTLPLVFTVANLAFPQAVGRRTGLTPAQQQASSMLRELVITHPEPAINTEFRQWIERGKVFISFQSDIMPDEMYSESVEINGKPAVALVVNPDFLLRSTSFNLAQDRKYKQLVLFHEYTHIANHFNGRIPLLPTMFKKEEIPARAGNVWNSEWAAEQAEWKLAKKMHVEYLVSGINAAVQKYGERRGFLEGFYEAMKHNRNVSHESEFQPYWDKLYQQEKAKLATKTKKP